MIYRNPLFLFFRFVSETGLVFSLLLTLCEENIKNTASAKKNLIPENHKSELLIPFIENIGIINSWPVNEQITITIDHFTFPSPGKSTECKTSELAVLTKFPFNH